MQEVYVKKENDDEREGNLPSPALEIEGIVRGEPDTGIVQSGGNVSLDEAQEEVFEIFLHVSF